MAVFEEEVIRSLRNGSDLTFGAARKILVGRDSETEIIQKDISFVCNGGSAIRVFLGDYGTGKTILGRIALEMGLDYGLLPIYVSEPPLHKPVETYQAIINGLITPEFSGDSLYYLLSQWSEKVIIEIESRGIQRGNDAVFMERINEKILDFEFTNDFNMAISAFIEYHVAGSEIEKKKIVDWMSGRKISYNELKNMKITRRVDNKEESYLFLKDILKLSKAIDYQGVVLVFDELELMQNLRSNVGIKGYESLRVILDMISAKELPNLYSVWLGTPSWFENPDKGVKSYLALFDRLKTEVSVTSESTVRFLEPVSPEVFEVILNNLSQIYEKAYNVKLKKSITSELENALKERLVSPFHGNNFVEMRQVVKSLIEFFDLLKDGLSASESLKIISGKNENDKNEQTVEFWT